MTRARCCFGGAGTLWRGWYALAGMMLRTGWSRREGVWGLLITAVACGKVSTEPMQDTMPAATSVAGSAGSAPLPPVAPEAGASASPVPVQSGGGAAAVPVVAGLLTRLPAAERVVAVGDLHGDFLATQDVLRLAGALEDGHWAGEKLVLVQTGDQLDRGGGEKEILDLFELLEDEAKAAGGRVIALNGNHELMNAVGDYRYVTSDALHDFDGLAPDSPQKESVAAPYQERAAAFLPGGSMALRLAERPVVAQVGHTIFVHGGLEPDHVRYGLDRLNVEVKRYLRGQSDPPEIMSDAGGPLWTRRYGSGQLDGATCALLQETLAAVGATRLVIGHTIQDDGISSACEDQVFRIDVGMSAYYGRDEVQALEIRGDRVRILSAKKR